MDVFGFTIARTKSLPALTSVADGRGGWWPIIREGVAGAWQRNVEIKLENVLAFSALYACVTLIASDIGKLRIKLVEVDAGGIWSELDDTTFSPVLRKPNRYQNRIKFLEQWITSKVIHGNTYVLKERNAHGVVTALYILDPTRVRPLVAPDGSVYYDLQRDDLSGVGDPLIVPAREIIHDVMVALYHPLVGVSPISACGLAAVQGLRIQDNSTLFFGNGSHPGGVLTAPGTIHPETATRLKAYWEANFTGANVGKVAVLGDGLKYEGMTVNAVDAQLIDQLKWTAENVCTALHVPPYMIGVGPPPSYANIEALAVQYYTQCLQNPIESIELCLDEGLELPVGLGTELDLDGLMRMDTPTKVKAAADALAAGFLKPNEARAQFDLAPVEGGDTPYLQQQNYSLAALNKRDQADLFAKPPAPGLLTPALPPAPGPASDSSATTAAFTAALLRKVAIFEREIHRVPAGSPAGGQFAPAPGGSGSSSGGDTAFLSTPSDAVDAIAYGEHATVAREDLRGVLERAATRGDAPDVTKLTVEGTPLFAGGLNLPRDQMPQIPKEHQAPFIAALRADGVRVTDVQVNPLSLRPTQNQIDASKVGQNLIKYDHREKVGVKPIFISSDGYVLDGHHRWALMAAVAFENPTQALTMAAHRIRLTHAQALSAMHAYDKAHGIAAQAHGAAVAALIAKGNPNHRPAGSPAGGQFAPADGGSAGPLDASPEDFHPSNPDGRDTQAMFSDGQGNYTPERAALHEAIVAKYLAGTTPVDHPVATVLGGGPAAGKSTLIRTQKLSKGNTVEVNVDLIRADLPETKHALAHAHGMAVDVVFAHEEASDIGKRLMARALRGNRNVSLDGTGDSSIDKLAAKVTAMRAAGHTVVGEYATVPTAVAWARATARALNATRVADRRLVPETALREIHKGVSRVIPEAIARGLFDRLRVWDTTEGATLIGSGTGKHFTVHDRKRWAAFLAKAQE